MYIFADKSKRLILGRQGENIVTEIKFPVSHWVDEFGAGTFEVLHRRPKDVDAAPVVTTYEDGYVVWTISEADVQYRGEGNAQLVMRIGDAVAKSEVFTTVTLVSLSESENPPEVWRAWVDQVLAAAADAKDAVTKYPRINAANHWEIWSGGAWVDTGVTVNGKDGEDGHTPIITASKQDKTTTVYVDGEQIATINDGTDGNDGHTPIMTGDKVGDVNTIYADGVPLISVEDGKDGESGITDVQINGASIVSGGVAKIPIASAAKLGVIFPNNTFGVSADGAGNLYALTKTKDQYGSMPNTAIIGKGTLNNVLAAPSIMPTLTDAEKAAARERIGLNDGLVFIETIDIGGVSNVFRNTEPDGTVYNFRDFVIRCVLKAGSGSPNLFVNRSVITYFPTATTVDRYATSRLFIYNGFMVSLNSNGVSNFGSQSSLYCTPAGVFNPTASGNITSFMLSANTEYAAGSYIEVYGVRA